MSTPLEVGHKTGYNTFSKEPLYSADSTLLQRRPRESKEDEDHRKFPSLYPSSRAKVTELRRTDAKWERKGKVEHQLGVLVATAISGNDILSSLLFVTALTAVEAGIYAPIAQILVVFTLWLYKGVYCEVLSALPMNGGCFNVLLHTTSKGTASIAACFSILSYVATCVCSGTSAIYYLHELVPGLDVKIYTVALLSFFAFLNLMGISESGTVALMIFIVHTLTLSLLVAFSFLFIIQSGGGHLKENWMGFPANAMPLIDGEPAFHQRGFWTSVFFGYGTAMLGVSGFESSSQFIEEQAPGVFPKTLNNMWMAIAVFNPLIMILALCVFPLPEIAGIHKKVLLSSMGRQVAGEWLHHLVAVDAFLVLAGAVLTAFVGVTGLVRRLALERCMPQWLLAINPCRQTNHNIILGFLVVCVSMFLLLDAQVEALSEMYSVCFLSLLLMFAAGHMMMKIKRSQLPRDTHAPWWTVILAGILVTVAFVAILDKNPGVVIVFAMYFSVTCVLVGAMFFRMSILKILLRSARYMLKKCGARSRGRGSTIASVFSAGDLGEISLEDTKESHGTKVLDVEMDESRDSCLTRMNTSVKRWIKAANTAPVVFFTKNGNIVAINKAVLYIRQNEDTQHIKIVHFTVKGMDVKQRNKLRADLEFLDRIYPKHSIDLIFVNESFKKIQWKGWQSISASR
eukprot:CAMPEP_0114507160 /NCGR_PEP_ID=MMETSP0109-20121206/11855_1 /TAXON_ID=29199 /ORGANISM="Chlorarachnion reptans, Strain CCCM449" /LENGTH=683 /DNA_ID=CAMNT_0001685881 /DNA_START=412 /DNA_END=2464 /DNA_ORIENTATION=-